jgi:hypothetical protein
MGARAPELFRIKTLEQFAKHCHDANHHCFVCVRAITPIWRESGTIEESKSMDMERREDEPDPDGCGRKPYRKRRFNMKQQFSGSQILVIFAIFCAQILRPLDEKGSAQKGAKITKA